MDNYNNGNNYGGGNNNNNNRNNGGGNNNKKPKNVNLIVFVIIAAVITFMNAWNSYLWPKVVMADTRAQTMPMLIANLASGYTVDYGVLMMGVLFCSIPTMIIFFVLQKQFAEGITGSVK